MEWGGTDINKNGSLKPKPPKDGWDSPEGACLWVEVDYSSPMLHSWSIRELEAFARSKTVSSWPSLSIGWKGGKGGQLQFRVTASESSGEE